MKKKSIKKAGIILSIACMLAITGCNSAKSNNSNSNSKKISEENQGNNIANDVTLKANIANEDKENKVIAPVANKEIPIYTFNDVTLEIEPATALVPEETELTPELVVDMVVDSFADRSLIVGIHEILTEDDRVIVSFLSDQAPLANVGSTLESTILDAIAQSIIENFPQYPKVVFREEGKEYTSGHYEFGIDEVYLEGNVSK